MTDHACTKLDPTCYRCNLNLDEVAPDLSPAEAEIVARFEAAPYPAEVLLSHLNRPVPQPPHDPPCTP